MRTCDNCTASSHCQHKGVVCRLHLHDRKSDEIVSLGNEISNLRAVVIAAQAIVDRWDSPLWGGSALNLKHTGEYIAQLRKALQGVA